MSAPGPCDYCGEPIAKADEFWVAAGASEKGELWHKSCWQKEISAVNTSKPSTEQELSDSNYVDVAISMYEQYPGDNNWKQPHRALVREVKRLRDALIEVDIYLAALNWWYVGNIGKAGEVIGNAIGWDWVRTINEQHAPRCCHGQTPPSVPGTSTAAGGRN